MPSTPRKTERQKNPRRARRRQTRCRYQVLLIDTDPQLAKAMDQLTLGKRALQVHPVESISDARRRLERNEIDLVLIDAALAEGSGLALAEELGASPRTTQVVLLAEAPDVDLALRAIRAGAADVLIKPTCPEELATRLSGVLDRQDREKAQADRFRRLRDVCKQLNQAREEVSQQVDTLCSDLVSAYQELACQVDQAIKCSEYAGMIRDELDLEQLLRRSLEYLIEKIGPTNAIVFLPSGMDSYSVGAFVSFQDLDGAELFRDHLADRVAPRIAERGEVISIADDAGLEAWLGRNDAAWLGGRQVIAVACEHEQETLAVLMLFRDQEDAFADDAAEICGGMAPLLAEALGRVIRVHHRALFDGDQWDEQEDLPW